MTQEQDSRLEDDFEDLPEVEEEPAPTQKRYEDYVNSEQVEEENYEDDLPDKYRGKDVKDIVSMHQNAEKLLGKQSQEVGELRRIVDDFIQSQTVTQQAQQAQTEDVDDLDFFENPKEAINRALANHPSVKQSQQLAAKLAQQEAVAKLKTEHPDYTTIINDSGFIEWVGKSKIRSELLRKADAYDYESANELFSLWKERQSMVNDAVVTESQSRKQSVRSGSTGNVKGSGERSTKKIYRRADIVELMQKNPQRYQALASEIRQAYAEGRVR